MTLAWGKAGPKPVCTKATCWRPLQRSRRPRHDGLGGGPSSSLPGRPARDKSTSAAERVHEGLSSILSLIPGEISCDPHAEEKNTLLSLALQAQEAKPSLGLITTEVFPCSFPSQLKNAQGRPLVRWPHPCGFAVDHSCSLGARPGAAGAAKL